MTGLRKNRAPAASHLLSAVVLTLTLASAPAAGAADSRVIARGVSVDGVDLSGMSVSAAARRVLDALVPSLARNILINVSGHTFRFSPGQARLAVDGPLTAKRAFYAGQQAQGTAVSVALAVHHDRESVRQYLTRLGTRVGTRARNATLHIGLTRITVGHSHLGTSLAVAGLARRIDAAIDSPSGGRSFSVALTVTHPAVTANSLIRQYTTVVTIDRAHFRLRLFKFLHIAGSYPIAVGRSGLETPPGAYHVLERQVNPSWHVPNSSWAGPLAGQTIPPGPNDPIVARWLGLGGGVGIHGTNEPFSIGSRASHGCIRMLVSDVIRLYPRVPLGTTVYIR